MELPLHPGLPIENLESSTAITTNTPSVHRRDACRNREIVLNSEYTVWTLTELYSRCAKWG